MCSWYDVARGTMRSNLREKAIKLRLQNKSYSEIKKRLGVSKSTLSYWLKDLPLSEEQIKKLQKVGWQKSEASRERYRNTMKAKRIIKERKEYQSYLAKFKKLSEESEFAAGLMLYHAEGGKKVPSRIALANTDPQLILFFIKWLIKFFNFNKADIRAQLHLYENMNIDKEENFWYNKLEFSKKQFYKSSIRKIKPGSFTYKDSIRHGTCSIYAFGVDKKRQLISAIQAFLDSC